MSGASKKAVWGAARQGVLEGYFETGFDGFVWMLYEDGKSGYDAQIEIEDGDYLTVFNPDGSIAFDGKIACDFEAGWTAYPKGSGNGQPRAFGDFWIHWTQKGWKPDDWARLFMWANLKPEYGGGDEPLRAVLKRRVSKRKTKKQKL